MPPKLDNSPWFFRGWGGCKWGKWDGISHVSKLDVSKLVSHVSNIGG
jgi:hypothetical protein